MEDMRSTLCRKSKVRTVRSTRMFPIVELYDDRTAKCSSLGLFGFLGLFCMHERETINLISGPHSGMLVFLCDEHPWRPWYIWTFFSRRAGGACPGTNKSGSSSAPVVMSDSSATTSLTSVAMQGEQTDLTRSRGDNVGDIGDPGAVANAKTDGNVIGELVDHNTMMTEHEEELTGNLSCVPTPGVDALMTSSGGEGDARPWTRTDMEAWANKMGVSDEFATVQSREGVDTSGSDGGRISANPGQRSMTSWKKVIPLLMRNLIWSSTVCPSVQESLVRRQIMLCLKLGFFSQVNVL